MEKTTLYIPKELQRGLRSASKRLGRSQAELVREAIERYLAGLDRPRPRSIGIGADGKIPSSEIKQWLRGEWDRYLDEERGKA
ncbi:MAG: ribbon-helix-helix protein, CopG family [bacterium]